MFLGVWTDISGPAISPLPSVGFDMGIGTAGAPDRIATIQGRDVQLEVES